MVLDTMARYRMEEKRADGKVCVGVRPFTFFEKGVVGHVGFADPFDEKLAVVCSLRCRYQNTRF